MDESVRDPREDISLIKHMLEKTAAGMKTVAPWFTWFGFMWLCYGVLTVVQSVLILNLPQPWPMFLARCGAVLGWLFYAALAVGFIVVRRRQAARGLDTLALKLIDLWGVCIVLFLSLCVVLSMVPPIAVRVLGLGIEQISDIAVACSLIRSYLFFLLPIAPLLMTALFLENRRMLVMCVALAILGALFCGCNVLLMYAGGFAVGQGWPLGSTAVACLLDIAPGVMLLVFGRQLKRA